MKTPKDSQMLAIVLIVSFIALCAVFVSFFKFVVGLFMIVVGLIGLAIGALMSVLLNPIVLVMLLLLGIIFWNKRIK